VSCLFYFRLVRLHLACGVYLLPDISARSAIKNYQQTSFTHGVYGSCGFRTGETRSLSLIGFIGCCSDQVRKASWSVFVSVRVKARKLILTKARKVSIREWNPDILVL